jgi:hypothetical protein
LLLSWYTFNVDARARSGKSESGRNAPPGPLIERRCTKEARRSVDSSSTSQAPFSMVKGLLAGCTKVLSSYGEYPISSCIVVSEALLGSLV